MIRIKVIIHLADGDQLLMTYWAHTRDEVKDEHLDAVLMLDAADSDVGFFSIKGVGSKTKFVDGDMFYTLYTT